MEDSSMPDRSLKRLLFSTIIVLLIIGDIASIRPTLAQTTSVSVNPAEVRGIAIGGTFTIDLYVAYVASLNSWEVFLGYNTAILEAESVTWGPFNPSAQLPYYIIDDATGLVKMYYLGVSGATVSGSGVIVTVGFTVTGIGESVLDIGTWNSGGTVPHNWLINVASAKITHDSYNGYFSNKLTGDITGPAGVPDGRVDTYDLALISEKFGRSDPQADFTGPAGVPDGKVDVYDLRAIGENFGEHL